MKKSLIFSMLACLILPLAQARDAEDIEAIADANDAGVGQMLNEMKDAEKKANHQKKPRHKISQEELIKECKRKQDAGEKPSLLCKKFNRPAPEVEIDIGAILSDAMKSKKISPDYCHKATDSQEAFNRCMEGDPAFISSGKKSRKQEGNRGRSPAFVGDEHTLSAE